MIAASLAPRTARRRTVATAAAAPRRADRRRLIDPTTCERDYGADELEFMQALDHYTLGSGRMFPTCSVVLLFVGWVGYEK